MPPQEPADPSPPPGPQGDPERPDQRPEPGTPRPGPLGGAKPKGEQRNPMILAGVGLQYSAVVMVLALGGWWLDGKLGTGHWMLVTGLVLGLVAGTLRLWQKGKRFFE